VLANINPAVVFINDKYINVENIYSLAQHGLSIQLDFFSGEKELLQFGSKQEIDRALSKLDTAQKSLDFGTNYAVR